MVFIGLDISKISTALCIEKDGITKLYSYSTKKKNNIWIKKVSEFIDSRFIDYKYLKETEYSKKEIEKLNEFSIITNLIIDDIFSVLNENDIVKIGIEGYSYNSKGPIFDLIEFSTILKFKLMQKLVDYKIIEIISPLTLKSECCKMVYKPRIELVGKRVIKEKVHHENTKGIQANNFNKWDMLYALLDSDLEMELKTWIINNINDITKVKDVPKPMDDIVDAIFLKELMKKGE